MVHYKRVPKDLKQNLAFRRSLLEQAKDKGAARELRAACAEDILFWVNAVAMIYEPRPDGQPGGRTLPFVTWDYQDESILKIDKSINIGKDLVIEKSRDMGASWMCVIVFLWRWHFHLMEAFLLCSRKEEYVDNGEDSKSLFWKMRFVLDREPSYVRPAYTSTKMNLTNRDNGSMLIGESTNRDLGTGDRRTAVLLDEFAKVETGFQALAATRDVANCRIFNSTPEGTRDAFFDRVKHTHPDQKLRLHWTIHPKKAEGLYHDADGKPRSPWYDLQCTRGSPQEIAQQLDIDYLGTNFQYFDALYLNSIMKRDCRPPYRKVPASRFLDKLTPGRDEKGDLLLWALLVEGEPLKDRNYVCAVDTATGTGASNSVITVGDCKTGEKVMEYAFPKIRPEQLAELTVGICKWFAGKEGNGAYLVWENNGPGRNFGAKVLELGYRHIYYQVNETSIRRKVSDIPGWYTSVESKKMLLADYRDALGRTFINRSEEAVKECHEYIYVVGADGKIEHSEALNGKDPSGALSNHGDRVIADALCCKMMKERGVYRDVIVEEGPPVGSLAWRRSLEKPKKVQWS